MNNQHIRDYRRLVAMVAVVATALLALPASAQTTQLGSAPMVPAQAQPLLARASHVTQASQALVVDPFNRSDVAYAYIHIYLPQGNVPMGFTGSVANCNPGTTSVAYRQAAIDRVNFYRAMAGLPGTVTLIGGVIATDTQAAALMFSANNALSHSPPSSWACYTSAGYTGANNSNIAAGYGNNAAAGPGAIDIYMDDSGSNNTAAGHRRWILYPPQVAMDSGSTPYDPPHYAANALWTLGPFGSRPTPTIGVAWPPRGYVPWQLLPSGSDRWSFSWPGANFSNAAVSMSRDGVPLSSPTDEPMAYDYGDNTLVWDPQPGDVSYAKPDHDTVYHITISGISGGGAPATIDYNVTVIDPYADTIFVNGFEF